MHKTAAGQLLFSPTDIVRFLESPFASWMERFRLECPGQVTPDEDSEELKLIAAEGIRHEERFLVSLQSDSRAVTTIERTSESRQNSRDAIDRGDGLIFQAHLAHGSFAGYADFLSLADEGSCTYEVWDTKLARSAKPHYLIQLCCYAEMLEGMGYTRPETLRLVLGNDETQTFRTADYIFAYAEAKRAFLAQMDSFDPAEAPTPDPRADHGRWASHAERELVTSDHLVQVAGISTGQIKKLQDSGITTFTALAETTLTSIPKLHPDIFVRLREQARLQVKTRQRQTETLSPVRPSFEVLAQPGEGIPQGLELLPPASPNDLFFDLEGYPLAEGGQGLEYLFGATLLTPDGKPQFADWWAHNPAQEQVAFEAFIDWAYARWVADPSMHIYHYAPYEITAMKRLMGTYGSREKEVDDLLRHGVFIDLYQVVRQGIRLGEDSYSLKKVERLYMDARDGDVKTAAASIVFYARWMESEQADTWQESEILNEIRDYNREDCDSTWKLAEWLREQQQRHQISWRPNSSKGGEDDPAPTVLPPEVLKRQQLASLLLDAAANDRDENSARISRLLAHLLDYHRREDKPVWWAVFERCGMTPEELVEDSDCLGNLRRTEDPPVLIKRSTGFWYAFDPGQDTKLSHGKKADIVPNRPAKVTIEELDTENGRAFLKIGNATLNKLEGGLPESLSLIPYEFVSPDPMPASIQATAEIWLQRRALPAALRKLLLREAPIAMDPALVRPEETATAAAVRIASQMDGATLCIQGPPGTGKTYTGAKVIIALLAQGKNIGVVSNSHKAVLNLLGECASQSPSLRGVKVGGDASPHFS